MSTVLRVAVVTPYFKEADDVLETCLKSVAQQTFPEVRHILVADGFPNPMASKHNVEHIILPRAHADNGNVARCIGAFAAIGEGFDAIAFLDADNWFREDHVERLVDLHHKSGAAFCSTGRTIHRSDGSLLGKCSESDGARFVDTSCMCFFRPAFNILPIWGLMPRQLSPVCDQVVFLSLQNAKLQRAHTSEETVAFRTQYAYHYRAAGEDPPPGSKASEEIDNCARYWRSLTVEEQRRILMLR